MAPTAAQLAQLRRMTNLTAGDVTYTDPVLTAYLENYPLADENGEAPYTYDSATPPVKVANTSWVGTYDLHAAAADVWEEKASAWAEKYSFSADGGNYSVNQAYEQCMAKARYHRARRASRTQTAVKWPKETSTDLFPWIGNLPEEDD